MFFKCTSKVPDSISSDDEYFQTSLGKVALLQANENVYDKVSSLIHSEALTVGHDFLPRCWCSLYWYVRGREVKRYIKYVIY